MKKAGYLLKENREKKNLSLHEIGMSLKINPKTLQAMEEGDLSKLPAKSFLRGFIKSYALYLKLDAQEVLNLYQSETEALQTNTSNALAPAVEAVQETVAISPPPAITNKLESTSFLKNKRTTDPNGADGFFSNKILFGSGALILVILIVITAKLVEKYQKERVIDRQQIEKIQAEVTHSDSPAPLTSNIEKPAANEEPKENVNVNVKESETKKEDLKTEDQKKPTHDAGLMTPIVIENQEQPIKSESEKAEKTKVDKKEVEKAKPIESVAPVSTAATEVIIEALKKVTIQFNLGDGKVDSLELEPDQFHTFKSKSVELEISDDSAISIILNGRERGVPGSTGKPIKLTYPKQ